MIKNLGDSILVNLVDEHPATLVEALSLGRAHVPFLLVWDRAALYSDGPVGLPIVRPQGGSTELSFHPLSSRFLTSVVGGLPGSELDMLGHLTAALYAAPQHALTEDDAEAIIAALVFEANSLRPASDALSRLRLPQINPRPVAAVNASRQVELFGGVWVVVAPTGGGKSSLIHGRNGRSGMSQILNAHVIEWGEPTVPQSTFGFPGLVRALGAGFVGSAVVIVDSAKQFLLSSKDNLGKGGLSGALQRELSSLSATLQARGDVLVLTINPLGLDGDDLQRFIAALEGTVEAVFVPAQSGQLGSTLSVRSRRGNARLDGAVHVNTASTDWLVPL